ncbi:MAG: hypothetical protein MUF49_12685 [Oculatellaceae cyanobacterium Prado106]|jgi:uncharacterized protein YutD|nr:hypothetical protein [Oculatellaceae cyanobacterium Prado106]
MVDKRTNSNHNDKNIFNSASQSNSQPKGSSASASSPKSSKGAIGFHLDPLKFFERLIADWSHLSVRSKIGELQIADGVNDPMGGNPEGSFRPGSSGGFSGGQFDALDIPLDLGELPNPSSTKERPWRWSLIWLSILGVFGGMGTVALVWLTSLPPLPNCEQVSQLTTDSERLYCAQQAAQSGELTQLVSGLEMLKQWGSEHPLRAEINRLTDRWSAQILTISRIKMQNGDAKGAIDAIKHIPKTSEVYAEGQEIVSEWRQQWQKGKGIYAQAQTAMKEQKWDDASIYIVELSKFDSEYWGTQQPRALSQQLGVERQARQALNQAQKLAKTGSYRQLVEAITVAQKVQPKTYAATEAKTLLTQWSQKLLTAGLQQWNQGDRSGAISTLYVPVSPDNAPEIQDLVRFGNAYMLANSTQSNWVPSNKQVFNLMEAIAALKQVSPESPFYAQAQTHVKQWQAHFKDVVQLKYASTAAATGQHGLLNLAIAQAKQVGQENPRRLQAQTLLAYWNQEVERIEDEPLIARAQQLAKSGKVPDLQAAIAQARQVPLGRSLRGQAQDLIANWRGQIEVIEDQPILARAKSLGQDGKLNEAIEVAAQIQSGRALYAEAQSVIWGWRAEQIRIAQIAEDEPILSRARSQAYNGSLSAAIDTAYQIGPGRALYYEAQGSIADWQAELNAIYAPPAPAESEAAPAAAEEATNPTTFSDDLSGDTWSQPTDSHQGGYSGGYSGDANDGSVPSSLELAPAEPSPSAEPAPITETPPPVIVDTIPMEEVLPQSSGEVPPVIEAPQSYEPEPSPQANLPSDSANFSGYYDPRYYNDKSANPNANISVKSAKKN